MVLLHRIPDLSIFLFFKLDFFTCLHKVRREQQTVLREVVKVIENDIVIWWQAEETISRKRKNG